MAATKSNKRALIIGAIIAAMFVVGIALVTLFSNRVFNSESTASEYETLKKDIESIKAAYKKLEFQSERYVGSIVLNRETVSLEKSRLDAVKSAREEFKSKVETLQSRETSDVSLKQSSSELAKNASAAADGLMALAFSSTTYVECISAPIGAPNEPEDLESDKQDLINCRNAAEQASRVNNKAANEYGKPIFENAKFQLSFYDDLERLGDFSSDENAEEYGKIDEKIFDSSETSVGIRQPRGVIASQNEAVDAYNDSYAASIKQVDEKIRSESRGE